MIQEQKDRERALQKRQAMIEKDEKDKERQR